jgi:hypothetical protein
MYLRGATPINFTSLIAPDTVAGIEKKKPLSKHMFYVNGMHNMS